MYYTVSLVKFVSVDYVSGMVFEKTLQGYENWRKSVESEIMWRQLDGKRNVWKVKDKIVLDNNGHAINHCGYKLLQAVLEKIDLDSIEPKGEKEGTVFFEDPVGYEECVQTSESDQIVYLQRNNRANVSRFVLNRLPEPCNSVFFVIGRIADTNKYVFRTAFVGTKSGREPWDKNANQEDMEFWKCHALVAPKGANVFDDLGDEGYWEKY